VRLKIEVGNAVKEAEALQRRQAGQQ